MLDVKHLPRAPICLVPSESDVQSINGHLPEYVWPLAMESLHPGDSRLFDTNLLILVRPGVGPDLEQARSTLREIARHGTKTSTVHVSCVPQWQPGETIGAAFDRLADQSSTLSDPHAVWAALKYQPDARASAASNGHYQPTRGGSTSEGNPGASRIKLRRADTVEAKSVEWLWPGRIPLGMLTLFAGDQKLGKSYATLALAAAVSRGAPLPDAEYTGEPVRGSVVLLSAEDDLAKTIVPRLIAAGADRSKVFALEAVIWQDGREALPSLDTDLPAIEEAIIEAGDCRLLVIDPVSAYLGATDDHVNSKLRGLLSPLKALAEKHNVAVVLVTHLNKSISTNAKHRVIGSVAYVGACRANFLFAKDRDDPTGRRILMADIGGNLAPNAPTLGLTIEDRGDGHRVEWDAEPVNINAEQALQSDQGNPDEREERRACDRWLRDLLRDGPKLASQITEAGRNAGFSSAGLNRAKSRIGAVTAREGFGKGARCYWSMQPIGQPKTPGIDSSIDSTRTPF